MRSSKKELHQVIDWSRVDKGDYLLAMERSPVKDVEIKALLRAALTEKIDDREVYMKGIDASYHYEGYHVFKNRRSDLKATHCHAPSTGAAVRIYTLQ